MKSKKDKYAVIYTYEEEGYGGPGGCNPSWTETSTTYFTNWSSAMMFAKEQRHRSNIRLVKLKDMIIL